MSKKYITYIDNRKNQRYLFLVINTYSKNYDLKKLITIF